jgi:hypothetical protein
MRALSWCLLLVAVAGGVFCLVALAGCEKREVATATATATVAPAAPARPAPAPAPSVTAAPAADRKPTAQVRLGGGADDRQPKLAFHVTRIYEHETPAASAPWHATGGDWTFFDCVLDGDDGARFTVGESHKPLRGDLPIGFGQAMVVPTDRASGERFVEAFARAFHTTVPAPAASSRPLKAQKLTTAILGENVDCGADGCGGHGHFLASKWFFERGKRNGEVFFDVDLRNQRGMFLEKDADYARDLTAIWAAILRDGG